MKTVVLIASAILLAAVVGFLLRGRTTHRLANQPHRAIAVLYFNNLSQDQSLNWLDDGYSKDLASTFKQTYARYIRHIAGYDAAYQGDACVYNGEGFHHVLQLGQGVYRALCGLLDILQVLLNVLQDIGQGIGGILLAASVQSLRLLFEPLLVGRRELAEMAQAKIVHRIGKIEEDLRQLFGLFYGIDLHRSLS